MRKFGVRIPISRIKTIPPPALTSPHNPNPGKHQHQEQQEAPLWRASVPPSPSRGYCSPTNKCTWLQSRGAKGRRNDDWRSSMHPLGCNEELLWELPVALPYLLQYTGMSIAACHSCLHTPLGLSSVYNHEMQELWSRKERKVYVSIQGKESQPTQHFKVNVQTQLKQVSHRKVSLLLISGSVTKWQFHILHLCPLYKTL